MSLIKNYNLEQLSDKNIIKFAVFSASQVAHLLRDKNSFEVLKKIELYLENKISKEEMKKAVDAVAAAADAADAAYYAVRTASAAVAANAAYAAAAALAAYYAIDNAAYAAVAVKQEQQEKQFAFLQILKKELENESN